MCEPWLGYLLFRFYGEVGYKRLFELMVVCLLVNHLWIARICILMRNPRVIRDGCPNNSGQPGSDTKYAYHFEAGSNSDLTIFRKKLREKLLGNEMIIGDAVYSDVKCIFDDGANPQLLQTIRNSHETIFSTFKAFNILSQRYRHDIYKHNVTLCIANLIQKWRAELQAVLNGAGGGVPRPEYDARLCAFLHPRTPALYLQGPTRDKLLSGGSYDDFKHKSDSFTETSRCLPRASGHEHR